LKTFSSAIHGSNTYTRQVNWDALRNRSSGNVYLLSTFGLSGLLLHYESNVTLSLLNERVRGYTYDVWPSWLTWVVVGIGSVLLGLGLLALWQKVQSVNKEG